MGRVLVFAIALSLPHSLATAQPIVRVRAETRIELQVARGPRVRIMATLRDDRGDPLSGRRVDVEISDTTTSHTAGSSRARATEHTDEHGRLEVSFDIARTGTYRLEARYRGDQSYRGVEVAQIVDLDRAHVRLLMTAETGRLDRLNLDLPSHAVRARAESEVGGAGLEVRLENEMGQVLASGTTGADGSVLLVVSSADLGTPAAGRVVVRTEGDARRAPAQTEVLVVRYRPTEVTLIASASHVAAGRSVLLEGVLRTSQGPLIRKAVGIFAGERHLETVLTDGEGRFTRQIVLEENDGRVDVQARFESDAPWRPEAASELVTITVRPRGATPAPWLMISIAMCALALLALWWRNRRDAPRRAEEGGARTPVAPGIQLGDLGTARQAGRADVGGIVLDADESGALPNARIHLVCGDETLTASTDADGRFRFESVPDGRWLLRAEQDGYESREATVDLPHRGRLSTIEIRLRSLRQLVLQHFRPLAEKLAPTRRWWAFWTPRELADRARGETRREVGEVTREVEEIAYAAPLPEAKSVEQIGQRAQRLADDLEEDSGTR